MKNSCCMALSCGSVMSAFLVGAACYDVQTVTQDEVDRALASRPSTDERGVRNRIAEGLAGQWVSDARVVGDVVFKDDFSDGEFASTWLETCSNPGSIGVKEDGRGGKCVCIPPQERGFTCLGLLDDHRLEVDPSRELAVLWETRQKEGGNPLWIQFDFYDAGGKPIRGYYQLRSSIDPTQPVLFQRNAHLVSLRMPKDAKLLCVTFHHSPKSSDALPGELANVRIVDLTAEVDKAMALGKEVEDERAKAGASDVLVYCDDNLTASYPVMPDSLSVPGRAGRTLKIVECPGERTRATVVLWSKSAHRNVEMRFSDLRGAKGGIIPSASVSAKVVKVHYQAEGAPNGYLALSGRQVLVPELLLNDDRLVVPDHERRRNLLKYQWAGREWYVDINTTGQARMDEKIPAREMPIYDAKSLRPFDLDAGLNKQIALRLCVPADAASDVYRGKIEFVVGAKRIATLKVALKVLPFALPAKAETIYDPEEEFTMGLYVWATINRTGEALLRHRNRSREQTMNEYRTLVDNGITSPSFIWNDAIVFDDAVFREHLAAIREAGFPGRTLHLANLAASGHIGNDTEPGKLKEMQSRLAHAMSVAKEFGFSDVYFYGFDEARGNRLLSQIPAWKAAHEVGAKVMVSGYAGHYELVSDWLDLLVFADGASGADPSAWHAKGHKIWKYNSPQAGPEDPGIFRRNYGLDIWKRGYDGASTYCASGAGTIWNDISGYQALKGKGGLGTVYRGLCVLYPTADGVIETLAVTGLESAIKDIRVLTKFRQLLRKRPNAKAQAWFDAINPETADLVNVRKMAIAWILKLLEK